MMKEKVRDLMTEDVTTLRDSDSARAAADLMDALNARHVPIVDKDGDLVGLVSQRDLLDRALSSTRDLPMSTREAVLDRIRLSDIMTSMPETVDADQLLSEAAQMIVEYKISCLPVVEGRRVIGILTESDFVKRFVEKG